MAGQLLKKVKVLEDSNSKLTRSEKFLKKALSDEEESRTREVNLIYSIIFDKL